MVERSEWQIEAMRRTFDMAAMRMPQDGDGPLGYPHLAEMYVQVLSDWNGFSRAKLGRWLGWMQCALVASGAASLDDMKEINRACSQREKRDVA